MSQAGGEATAQCPVCGKRVTVLKSGVLRHHVNSRIPKNGIFSPLCRGAGQPPA